MKPVIRRRATDGASFPWRVRQRLAAAWLLAVLLWGLGSAGPQARGAGAVPDGFQALEGALLSTLTLDSDQDGLFDAREAALGTNPQNPDSDGDGWSDAFEDLHRVFGFDPLAPSSDLDADGLTDDFEQLLGTLSFDPDSDNDGWSDLDEVMNAPFGFHPLQPSVDRDFDGLTDLLEQMLGTNPLQPDSDGDGANDFQEYSAGFNPLQPDAPLQRGELIGRTHSQEMEQALFIVRQGGQFPRQLARQLPYPQLTAPLVEAGLVMPSAALMQQSVFIPGVEIIQPAGPLAPADEPAKYDSYADIVKQLQAIAEEFDGAPKPAIVRLFQYSGQTTDKNTLFALKISDKPEKNEPEPEILFLSMHHARELITTSIVMGLIRKLVDGYAAGDAEIKRIVDHHEIWVIPIVNPDGYTKALGACVDWRKNTRMVTEKTPETNDQTTLGVDLNRNYAYEHISTLGAAALALLTDKAKSANGLRPSWRAFPCQADPDEITYAGASAFSEVETRAVRDLVNNRFPSDEIKGIKCSLSWHSSGGEVTHALGHASANKLNADDKKRMHALTAAFAAATGYTDYMDVWYKDHYPTYGDSDDWLHKEKSVHSLTVESFHPTERGFGDPDFYPKSKVRQKAVVDNNIKGALAFIKECSASDLGDAPDRNVPRDYPTRRGNNGAIHLSYHLEWLGNKRTPKPSVSQEVDAIDALDEDKENNLVDHDHFDDGVFLPSAIRPGVPFDVRVLVTSTISESGFGPKGRYDAADPKKRLYLNAWADWENDESWKEAGNKIIGSGSPIGTAAIDPKTFGADGAYTPGEAFTDADGDGERDPGEAFIDEAGVNSKEFIFTITPPSSLPTNIWFRFRLDYGENVKHVANPISESTLREEEGPAQFGEVEDYAVPTIECDYFRYSEAAITLATPLGSETVHLMGPTLVKVYLTSLADADGNGLEEVPSVMTQLDLRGTSRLLGPVSVRLRDPALHPFQRSTGRIEETANVTAGNLDLPPFAATGTATSSFDVYFEITAAGMVLHNEQPKRMRTTITHKPPGEGERYEYPEIIPLLDQNNLATGVRILSATHTPNPTPEEVEPDYFPNSLAKVTLLTPFGAETVRLTGPTRVAVHLAGLQDVNNNGREEVGTEIVDLALSGVSRLFGPVTVRLRDPALHPAQRAFGVIEETLNTQAARLDLPPFAADGSAESSFDMFFEIEAGGMVLHNQTPKRMRTTITHKPPREGETYENPDVIDLFDANNNLSAVRIANVAHTPNPRPQEIEVDPFPYSTATVTFQAQANLETVRLMGPATVNVFLDELADVDRNGAEEVPAEFNQMHLRGYSAMLGPVTVRLRPQHRPPFQASLGSIEEALNATPATLDLPPFTPSGSAMSSFNVFFEVEAAGQVLHNVVPKFMRTTITHKPPREGETYENPDTLQLFDESNQPTTFAISGALHTPNPLPHEVEVDYFPSSVATIALQTPFGSDQVLLSGPTKVAVHVAAVQDADRNGRDEAPALMAQLELKGFSPRLGPVSVRLRDPGKSPFTPTFGLIEENNNSQPGQLDLPPLTPTGSAASSFEVFFEIEVGGQTLHNQTPARMAALISRQPPARGETYTGLGPIQLFDEENNPVEAVLQHVSHTPDPGRVPVPPFITGISYSAQTITVSICFTTQAGVDYLIESTAALGTSTWQPVRTVVGTGSVVLVSGLPANRPMQFYRVQVLEGPNR